MVYKVLIINLMGLILCIGQNPTLYLTIVRRGSTLTCPDTTVTVLEGEPLTIEVKHDRKIAKIELSRRNYNLVWSTINGRFINIEKILPDMGTQWTCKVEAKLTNLPSPGRKTQYCKNGNYYMCEMIECRIKMHVRWKEAPQVILVNGMLLPSKRAPLNESYDALAEYTFNDGDLVDVTCANAATIQQKCHLFMGYDYLNRFLTHNNSYVVNSTSLDPVGFKFYMRAENDETHAICECYELLSQPLVSASAVRVNFLMRKRPIGNSVNVYINNAALRPTTVNENMFEYTYKTYEWLNVICESVQDVDTARFVWVNQPKRKDMHKDPMKNEKGVALYPFNYNYYSTPSFQCKAGTDKIVVTLVPRGLHEAENVCSMKVWIQHSNAIVGPFLKLYQPGVHYFIYEYKDYDMLNLLCEANCKTEAYVINLVSSGRNNIIHVTHTADNRVIRYKNISKSEIDEDNAFKWVIKEGTTKRPVLISNIVFIRTPAPPAMHFVTDPIKEGSYVWVLPIVGSVSCIVIICVIVVIYKMRTRWNHKNNEQPGDVNYKNLPKDVNDPIPPFPRQWDSPNIELVDQTKDSTYSDPPTGPYGHAENELYNIPMTIDPNYNKRDADQHNMTNELNYAEIMHNKKLDPDAKVPKTRAKLNGNDDSNYVQVLVQNGQEMERRGAGNMYANVDDGRYATNSDYAEPTYCEPTNLIKKN